MDRLRSLKEELAQMEEAYSNGQLNQGEIEYMARLRAEIERSENILQEAERLYQEDEWIVEHLKQQEEMKRELAQIESEYRLKKASVERSGLLFDPELEALEKKRNNLANEISRLSQEIEARKEGIRRSVAESFENSQEEVEIEPEIELPDDVILRDNLQYDASLNSYVPVSDDLKYNKGYKPTLPEPSVDEMLNKDSKYDASLNNHVAVSDDLKYNKGYEPTPPEPSADETLNNDSKYDASLNNHVPVSDDLKYNKGYEPTPPEPPADETLNNDSKYDASLNNHVPVSDDLKYNKGYEPTPPDPPADETLNNDSKYDASLNNHVAVSDDLKYNKEYTDQDVIDSISTRDTAPILPSSEEPIGLLPPGKDPEPIGLLPPGKDPEPIGLLPPGKDPEPIGLLPPGKDPEPIGLLPPGKDPEPQPTPNPEPQPTPNPEPQPTPNPEPQPTPNPKPIPQEVHYKRSLETIIYGLIEGEEVQGLKGSDYAHFQGRNIKITPAAIKSEIFGEGPLAYRIAHIPKIITHVATGIVTLGRKISGTLLSTRASRKKIQIIQDRLANLSEEDLQTLREEYRGSRITEAKLPKFLDSMIADRLRELDRKDIARLTVEAEAIVNELYQKNSIINEIDALRTSGQITPAEAERRIALVAEGSAELIRQYKAKNAEITKLSSHGTDEDIRASHSGMNIAGRRGAKKNDEITGELQGAWRETSGFEQGILDSLQDTDDLGALDSFIDYTNAVQRHTAHKRSILFGDRSVGIRESNPIARQLDYREDPLLKDLTSSVMQIVAIANIANSVATELRTQQMVRDHNAAIAQHNAEVDRTGRIVHNSGDRLVAHEDAYGRGMQTSAMQRMEAQNMTHEDSHLREFTPRNGDWTDAMLTDEYARADADISHTFDGQVFTGLRDQFTKAGSDLSAGTITPQQYLGQIRDISNQFITSSHSEFEHAYDVALRYASEHPQFDLTACQGTLDYTVQHVQDLIDMNDAMVESVDIGRVLQSLPMEHAEVLGQLPSSLVSNVITSAVLSRAALQVAKRTEGVVGAAKEAGITAVISESVRTQDKEELIRDAEARYYGMSKLRQVLATMEWRHIQELKKVTELTPEDVETIKGAFK